MSLITCSCHIPSMCIKSLAVPLRSLISATHNSPFRPACKYGLLGNFSHVTPLTLPLTLTLRSQPLNEATPRRSM